MDNTIATFQTTTSTQDALSEAASLYAVGSELEHIVKHETKAGKTGLKPENAPLLLTAVESVETVIVPVRYNKGAILDLVQKHLTRVDGMAQITKVTPKASLTVVPLARVQELLATGEITPAQYALLTTTPKDPSPYPKVTIRPGKP